MLDYFIVELLENGQVLTGRDGILLFKKLMFQWSIILGKSKTVLGLGERASSSFLSPRLIV